MLVVKNVKHNYTMKKLLLGTAFLIIGLNGFAQDVLVKVSPFHFFDGIRGYTGVVPKGGFSVGIAF